MRGTVGDSPWGLTLGSLGARKFTGQLLLQAEGKQYGIAFERGDVIGATSPAPADAVARIAMTAHLVTSSQVPDLMKRFTASPEREDIDVLAEAVHLSGDQVAELRRRVVIQRAARTFSVDEGEYILLDQIAMPITPGTRVDIGAVIYTGVRMNLSEQRLAVDMRALGSHFMLAPAGIGDAARFGFGDDEKPVVDALRTGSSMPALEAVHRELDPRTMQAIIYTLVSCGVCATTMPIAAPPQPSVGSTSTSDPALGRAPTSLAARTATPTPAAAVPRAATRMGSGILPRFGADPRPPADVHAVDTDSDTATPSMPDVSMLQTDSDLPTSVPPPRTLTPSDYRSAPSIEHTPSDYRTPLRTPEGTPSDYRTPSPTAEGTQTGSDGRIRHNESGVTFLPASPRAATTSSSPPASARAATTSSSPPASARAATTSSSPPASARAATTSSSPPTSPRAPTTSSPPVVARAPSDFRNPQPSAERTPSDFRNPQPSAERTPSDFRNPQPSAERTPSGSRTAMPMPSRTATPVAGSRQAAPPYPRSPTAAPQTVSRTATPTAAPSTSRVPTPGKTTPPATTRAPTPGKTSPPATGRTSTPPRAAGTRPTSSPTSRTTTQPRTGVAAGSQPGGDTEAPAVARTQSSEWGEGKLDATPNSTALAEEAFKRGERALKRDDVATAVSDLRQACELNPKQLDYMATYAWAKFCAAPDKEKIAGDTRKTLEKSIHRSEKPEIGRFYLGRVERMLGRDREALRHFNEVLLLVPNHREAASEVRILEARLAANSKR